MWPPGFSIPSIQVGTHWQSLCIVARSSSVAGDVFRHVVVGSLAVNILDL